MNKTHEVYKNKMYKINKGTNKLNVQDQKVVLIALTKIYFHGN